MFIGVQTELPHPAGSCLNLLPAAQRVGILKEVLGAGPVQQVQGQVPDQFVLLVKGMYDSHLNTGCYVFSTVDMGTLAEGTTKVPLPVTA